MDLERNKTGGRQKGTSNKTTASLRSVIHGIVERQFETLESDLQEMEAKDKLSIVLKLIEYVLPKQRETKIDFNSLSDAEIDELINKLKRDE